MNRINAKFRKLKADSKKGFIAYITAGDPTLDITKQLVLSFEKAGVDIIELGVPFSDPLADGVVNQRAAERALRNKVSLRNILATVKDLRNRCEVPIVLFTYINPILKYGIEKISDAAQDAGVDGILALDFPPEEASEYKKLMDRNGISTVSLVAPTSTDERIRLITQFSTGFVYYVSRTGVTGIRESVEDSVKPMVEKIRKFTDKPVAVGFGISNPDQAYEVSRYADGIVVGSAIVKKIEDLIDNSAMVEKVTEFVSELMRPLKEE